MTQFEISKPAIRNIGMELEAVLKEFAATRGINLNYAGGSFDDVTVTLKLKLTLAGDAAEAAAKKHWANNCRLFNMLPENFGATFTHKGSDYRISGLEMGRSRFPIRATDTATGKFMLFTSDIAKKLNVAKAA